ncbi:MAG: hypothetical protein HKN19_01030 [Halioglobus sp.]|nr:hypothetical protein [Halioglobus sp.]
MIFAEFRYDAHYSDMHDEILEVIRANFPRVEHGHQGDSWIWVFDEEHKVAIDSFSSMQHEVKAGADAAGLAGSVIAVLASHFELQVLSEPELEPHEDG